MDAGLWRDAGALAAELTLVNGLDASELGDVLIDDLAAGGVSAVLVTSTRSGVGFGSSASPHHQYLLERADRIGLATTVADIERLEREGRIAIVFGLQVPDLIEEDASKLVGLHAMGLRSCGLAYNVGNYIGSGCTELDQGPLSRFGIEVVERLQALRIVVDIAGHCSEATAADALRHTKGPVVCSHTAVRALRNNPRGMTDGMFRAIADRGGVVGIAAFSYFLVESGRGTVADYLRHLIHAIRLVGPAHVGIGLDFILGKHYSGPMTDTESFAPGTYPQRFEDWVYPEGLASHTGLRAVIAGLLEAGYSDDQIAMVMGGNWLRVWREVWGA